MPSEPDDFLPLRPVELEVLVSLRGRSLHGYGILQEAEREGRTAPGLVTLYRALRRMEERGLVERDADTTTPAPAEDDRRRTYRMTALGRSVLRAEALRLSPLVRAALGGGVEPDEGESA